jgi:hypothetical protein
MLVALFNAHIVISPLYVKFGEDAGVLDFSNDRGEKGKRVVISFGHCINCAVVLDWSLFAIFLC